MKEYQKVYMENLKKIACLADLSGEIPGDVGRFLAERRRKMEEVHRLIAENTELLRRFLMPVLDDIVSAKEDEVGELTTFAQRLMPGAGQLDLVLSYIIHNALIAYARKWNRRDMLIRELYMCGMSLFYMQNIMDRAGKKLFSWKLGMMFGEAASYIKCYDEIADPETRGYIHRAMGNMALADSWAEKESGRHKLRMIRDSLQILTDPVYQEKTPSLPWDIYIYKSHQERMTAVDYMRRGFGDAELVKELLESAEYVMERRIANSGSRGGRLSARWTAEYEAVLYHCGVRTLPELLLQLEKLYMAREISDYSENGIWQNIFLPGMYAAYVSREAYGQKKKEVVCHMYRMLARYVRNAPNNQLNAKLTRDLTAILESFLEYPDGILQKDFLLNLIACRNPDIYAYFHITGNVSGILAKQAVREKPEAFIGVLSCETVGQVKEKEKELVHFAYESGMLHDVGVLLFSDMVTLAGRNWTQEEETMYENHVYAGQLILSRCDSTGPYALTALGHHRYYDEKGGYPKDYKRQDNPDQAVTDIVSIAGFLTRRMDDMSYSVKKALTFDQALEQAQKEAGTRLNPDFVSLLPKIRKELKFCLTDGKKEAYEKAFELLNGQV